MFKIYNINSLLIKIFGYLLNFYSPFSEKIKKGVIGRKISFEKLKLSFNKDDSVIHIHCASHGEYLLAKKLILGLKENYKSHKFLLSFISPSGYENADRDLFDCVIYLPLATENNCIDFYNTKRSIKTLSVSEARKPIYKSSLSSSSNFNSYLKNAFEKLDNL